MPQVPDVPVAVVISGRERLPRARSEDAGTGVSCAWRTAPRCATVTGRGSSANSPTHDVACCRLRWRTSCCGGRWRTARRAMATA